MYETGRNTAPMRREARARHRGQKQAGRQKVTDKQGATSKGWRNWPASQR